MAALRETLQTYGLSHRAVHIKLACTTNISDLAMGMRSGTRPSESRRRYPAVRTWLDALVTVLHEEVPHPALRLPIAVL